ncbi:MAG: LacI family DNA-binding transcriptional regulator [Alkalispirochaeta sp.]
MSEIHETVGRGGRRATRKDVAELAGVSVATVSYVMNDQHKVPEKTAERVREAVEKLNYRPDLVARSLATKRTSQLAIVINNISNPIYSDLILGFENNAIEAGYFVNICTGNTRVDDYIENFISRSIDGIFIEALPHKYDPKELERLLESDIKIVIFGRTDLGIHAVSSVETDYTRAMELAIHHLRELGHRKIAYLSGLTEAERYDARIDAFRAVCTSQELTTAPVFSPAEVSNTDITDGERLAAEFLAGDHGATAVVCTNDLMAIGAMNHFRNAGLSVPEDISVVGIDDSYVTSLTHPRLTSVHVPYHDVGRRAFELLHADVTHNRKDSYQITPELVVRESTAPPADYD